MHVGSKEWKICAIVSQTPEKDDQKKKSVGCRLVCKYTKFNWDEQISPIHLNCCHLSSRRSDTGKKQTTVLLDLKIDLFFQQRFVTVLEDTRADLPVKARNQPVLYFMCHSGVQ